MTNIYETCRRYKINLRFFSYNIYLLFKLLLLPALILPLPTYLVAPIGFIIGCRSGAVGVRLVTIRRFVLMHANEGSRQLTTTGRTPTASDQPTTPDTLADLTYW